MAALLAGKVERTQAQREMTSQLLEEAKVAEPGALVAVDIRADPRFEVPARGALSFTAAEPEAGSDDFAGALGDGAGKWRLTVTSDEPIQVMSLLESPTGHLTNLSTGPD